MTCAALILTTATAALFVGIVCGLGIGLWLSDVAPGMPDDTRNW